MEADPRLQDAVARDNPFLGRIEPRPIEGVGQSSDQPSSGVEVVYTLTRTHPPDWSGYTRRVDAALLAEMAWPAAAMPLAYVCGPTSFVEAVSQALVQAGYPPQRVKTERFGATGGT